MESKNIATNIPNQSVIAQAQIREQSVETVSAIKDLNSWTAEMKQKEKDQLKNTSNKASTKEITVEQQVGNLENLMPPVRSDVEGYEQFQSSLMLDPKAKADVFKESGNRVMKETQNHSEALIYYTKAIDCFNKDATYFFNRAICHMKLENYQDSLHDLNSAVELNAKYCKAYFNRIKVFIALEQYERALIDYNTVLELDPEMNKKMKKEHEIILIKTTPIKDWSSWSSKKNCKQIDFIDKAPHLRSKKPMKKLQITEIISPTTSHTYSDAVIDKLFNNNTGEYTPEDDIPRSRYYNSYGSNRYGDYASTSKSTMLGPLFGPPSVQEMKNVKNTANVAKETACDKPKASATITTAKVNKEMPVSAPAQPTDKDELIDLSIESIDLPCIPKTVQQFYTTWLELKDVQKFLYLKNLSAAKEFGTLLGASFDSDTLTDILRIMSKYFVKHETPVAHILKTMAKNQEFKIIQMWITADDKKAITDLLDYMQKSSVDATDIATIKKAYLT